MNEDLQYVTRAATFSLQCAAILDNLHRQDRGTGFHRRAARNMADRALAALDAVSQNPGDADEAVADADEAATSAVNILRAYLKQRNEPQSDDGDGE